MSRVVLKDSTGKTQIYQLSEQDLYSTAATEPRRVDWFGRKTMRWLPVTDPGRVRNLPWVFGSVITSTGPCDAVILSLGPDLATQAFFSLEFKPGNQWLQHDVFARIVEGPSPVDPQTENATVQEVEDAAFSKAFIEHFRPALAHINRLADLEEGWDSYGANRIDPKAGEAAVEFLRLLHSAEGTISPPIAGPSPSGAVVLQWSRPDLEVFIEIGSDGHSYYVAHPDEEEVRQEGTISELKDLVSTLLPFFR